MEFNSTCPIPISQYPHVVLAHGGGGKLMHQLIGRMFLTAFGNPILNTLHDAAVLEFLVSRASCPFDSAQAPSESEKDHAGEMPVPLKLAFTTDSYVVRPLFFPGGDIGSMAVHGTVNDLAMAGARPLYLSSAFIIEVGLPMETLWKIVCSMRDAAKKCGVQIVTGDTKVVDKGKGDGLFINTAGVGVIEFPAARASGPFDAKHAGETPAPLNIAPQNVRAGDAILVSGDLGRHGMAIMAVREGLEFESKIESDSAPVHEVVLDLLKAGIEIHCLRDLTRGGLTSALNEIAEAAGMKIAVEEKSIPVREDVHAACEMLGLDPLNVANEGRFIAFVAAKDSERALEILRRQEVSANAALIGKVIGKSAPVVTLKSAIGVQRILDMASGEQLPRIC